ncbi:MAG: hypothetical protein ACRD01_06485 [Terriglobales bacterium]
MRWLTNRRSAAWVLSLAMLLPLATASQAMPLGRNATMRDMAACCKAMARDCGQTQESMPCCAQRVAAPALPALLSAAAAAPVPIAVAAAHLSAAALDASFIAAAAAPSPAPPGTAPPGSASPLRI